MSRVSIVGWIQTNFGVNNLRILLWKFCSSFCSRGWGGNPNCTNRLRRFLFFSMWMGVAVMQTEGITYINQTWRAHVNSKLKQKILSFASDWLCAVGFLDQSHSEVKQNQWTKPNQSLSTFNPFTPWSDRQFSLLAARKFLVNKLWEFSVISR